MKHIVILFITLLSCSLSAQVQLYQLEYAPDSSYVIGALPDGEATWISVSTISNPDSIYTSNDTIFLRDGSGFAVMSGGGGSGTVTSVGLATGTTGTDVNVIGSPITTSGTFTLNIPTASATNTGKLSNTDWTTFNNKVDGTGTATRIPYWQDSNTLTDGDWLKTQAGNYRLLLGSLNRSMNIGINAGNNNQGNDNMNIGINAGNLMTASNSNNINIGSHSGYSMQSGISNINLGRNAYIYGRGSYNVNIGDAINGGNTSTGSNNVYIGRIVANSSGSHYENVGLGYNIMNTITTAFRNVGNGSYSLLNLTSGSHNLGLGFYGAAGITSGSNNVGIGSYALAFGTGTRIRNVGIGNYALANTTGEGNVGIGVNAGRYQSAFSVCIGMNALANSTAIGSSNVGIGFSAGFFETGSNRLYIENSSITTPLIGGHFDNNRIGINTEINSISRTLHVTGEARITDLITDTPTKIVGADNDGDLGTITIGSGLSLSGGTLTNTSTSPQTWADFGTNMQAWFSTGVFGSGKDVGIGVQPTRDLDVNGTTRLRGAIYNSANSSGTSGQVLTSQGSGAWTWTTISSTDDQNLSYGTKSGTDVPLNIQDGIGVIFRDGRGNIANRVSSNVFKIDNEIGYGKLENASISGLALTTTLQKIDLGGGISGGFISHDDANDRFTVSATSAYMVTVSCDCKKDGADYDVEFQVRKNNSSFIGLNTRNTIDTKYANISGQEIEVLSNGDYIELFAKGSTTSGTIDCVNFKFIIHKFTY